MKTRRSTLISRTLLSVLAFAAITTFAMPQMAQANSTADATILNVVQVDYTDASGINAFVATASSAVTINLVPAALTASAPPTAADANPGLTCLAGSFNSGDTVNGLYALTANANGDDNYTLSIANTPTDASNVTVAYNTLDYLGNVAAADPASVALGSAVPVAVINNTTLEFPGGALAGFAADDIVVIEHAAGKMAYLVDTVTVGSAASHDNPGGAAHTDQGNTTAEVTGTLVLKAFPAQLIDGVNVGGAAAPTFTTNAPVVGSVAAELVLIQINVTASTSVAGTDGTVDYTLTATDSAANPETINCTVTFAGADLTITKEVRNFTANPAGAFVAAATGNPGDILEYRVTINNAGGNAASVVVTDAVPTYTTLQDNVYGAGVFAQISDGTNTADITLSAADSETQPIDPIETGFGNASGTAAGQSINFYLGDGSDNATGGTLASGDSFTIVYRVQID